MEKNNPSYKCMRIAREESRAELLEMRRWDVSRRLKALQLPESGSHDMLSRIARVIYPTTTGWTREACNYLRDQLAELIGGERDAQHDCAGGAGGCDCRHESEEVDGQSRTCPESGPDVSESDDGASITSELRKYLDLNGQEFTNYKDELIATISGGTSALYAIADRIDEQFARICEQQEKVLQDTIGEMLDEIDRQKDLRGKNAKTAEDAIHNSCMYFDLLRDAARDYEAAIVVKDSAIDLLASDESDCRMYRTMLNDAARDYKALRDKLNKAFSITECMQNMVNELHCEMKPRFDEVVKMFDDVLDAATDPIDEFAYDNDIWWAQLEV